jgi:predicted RecB family nuclease
LSPGHGPSGSGSGLTKSRYLAGLQCPRRLWLALHRSEAATEPDAADGLRADEGREIERHAQALFPAGRRVEARERAAALDETARLLRDPSVPAIFEAAFAADGLWARVDVLERLGPDSWALHEVKSATRVRSDHMDDVAFQLLVLEANGIEPERACVLHTNASYVRGDGEVDWSQFLRSSDVTRRARNRLGDVRADLVRLRAVPGQSEPPRVEPSEHCRRPRWCAFWDHCTSAKPVDWIGRLPGLTGARLVWLQQQGIEHLDQIPADFELSDLQLRVKRSLTEGRELVSDELAGLLEDLGPPTLSLDFETWGPAIPQFSGTRPFQQVPFQWSLHAEAKDGALTHSEFLAPSGVDPRRPFAESLLAALGDDRTPVLVYSGFEGDRLRELARDLPDLARRLDAVRARLCDLHALVRGHVYHPGFGGSFSLKRIAPALVPGFGYADLESVAGGGEAVVALERLATGGLEPEAETQLRRDLLSYCARDTLALVEVHRALRARAQLS